MYNRGIKTYNFRIKSVQNVQKVYQLRGPVGSMRQVVGLPNNSYKPITNTAWVHTRLCKLQTRALQRTFHGCFLPNFDSFGQAVTEEKILQKSTNQKQELPMVAMFVNGSELNEQSLQRTFQGCFLPSFALFGKVASEENIFQKSTNQKQEWPVVAMFVNGS